MNSENTCRLIVLEGDHPGMIYPLKEALVTIGRGPECTIQVIDTRMSRIHAELNRQNGSWTVQDLRSKNGTTVNDAPIAAGIRLVAGDTIALGNTTFSFEAEMPSDSEISRGGEASKVRVVEDEEGNEPNRISQIPILDPADAACVEASVPQDADERLKSIYQVGKIIQSLLDLDELLDKVMETVSRVLKPTYGCILLQNAKLGILVPKVIHSPADSNDDLIISGTIIRQAMKDQVAVLMEDGPTDERFKASDSIVVHRITSAIGVPLISKGIVLGVLYIDTREFGRCYNDSDLEWAVGVGCQAALAIDVAMHHSDMIVEHRRERELEIARTIQMNLLPKKMPAIEGFEFGGLSEPARMVGGDYFDIMELPEGDVALAIADVSGKGVPSAILVSSVRTAVRIEARSLAQDGIVEVMTRLNEIVCEQTMSHMFVTMVLAYFEPETRRLTYCNAGHVYPILRMADGELIELKDGGCFLGIMPGIDVEKGSVKLPPGSMVVFVSDGATDAVDSEGEMYGDVRVLDFLREHHALEAQEFCDRFRSNVTDFQGNEEQFDDFTVMVVKAL